MRVIAGSAKHLLLKTPAGYNTRPTTDRIKETLFNMIQYEVPGAVFLDLFSGSGGIGIEALSRGAARCYFVEKQKEALQCIRDNLMHTKLADRAVVMAMDADQALEKLIAQGVRADIVFMDPPYRQDMEKQVLTRIATSALLHSDSIVIAEAAAETEFTYAEALGMELYRQKRYGTNQHVFFRKTE